MKFIETNNPDILKTRRGGGLAIIFGVVFLLTGLLVTGLSCKVTGETPWYVPAIFGAVFLTLGMAMTFGRNGIVIDRRRGTMAHWFGLMVPMKKTYYSLDQFDHIAIYKDVHHGDKRLHTVYPVAIRSKRDGVRGLIFHEPGDYTQARNEAQKFAAFLQLPIVDTVSGKEIVKKPERLTETFRQKEKRIGGRTRLVSRPPVMISKVREKNRRLLIDIPPRKLSVQDMKRMALLMVIGFASLVVMAGWENLRNMSGAQLAVYAPAVLVIILFATNRTRRRARMSWRIIVSDKSLKVEQPGSRGKNIVVIPNNELEDLVMGDPLALGGAGGEPSSGRALLARIFEGPPQKAITASSGKATVTFGHGVEEEELTYLYHLIGKRITEPPA